MWLTSAEPCCTECIHHNKQKLMTSARACICHIDQQACSLCSTAVAANMLCGSLIMAQHKATL